jgi:site-specific DNA-methyltransferase (adenine-specific)
MPITSKVVKGMKYIYFNYYDPDTQGKKEYYCGRADDPKAVEKANELERNYTKSQISLLQNHLKEFDPKSATNEPRKAVRTHPLNLHNRLYPQTKEVLKLLKSSEIFEPKIHYKSCEDMSEVPSGSVQLIITSPPYNVGKEYQKHDDNMEQEEYLKFLNRVWVECQRVLCKGGRIAVNVADTGRQPYLPLHVLITEQFLKLKFLMRGVIIWDKGASAGISTAWGSYRSAANPTLRDISEHIMVFSKDNPQQPDLQLGSEHEHIVVFSKDSYRLESKNTISTITPDQYTEYTKSVWRFPTVSAINGHPAPFPEELPKRLIQLYTFLGDTVLDPFLGSGTTCKVAKAWGRKSIGYEIDESYKPIIEKRLAEVEDLAIPLDSFTKSGPQNMDDFEESQVGRTSETNLSS